MGRKILLAVDGSESSNYMVEWSLQNFLKKDDSIYVLHSYEIPSGAYAAEFTSTVYDLTEKVFKASATELVSKTKRIIEDAGFPVGGVFVESDGKEGIVTTVEEEKVDVLIIGSRGLGMIKRSFLGSTSDYCVHNCNCPVIVVKKH